MTGVFTPFFIAVQFLTRLPIRLRSHPKERDTGRSLLYYPLVGLLIGCLLAALGSVLTGIESSIAAAILLTAWVLLTGALHLDGLGDSADAWLGGLGDRDRTLAIMKDPYSGPAAVVSLVLVLLLKFAALGQILREHDAMALLLIPLLGRTAPLLLFVTTPYARKSGLGSPFSQHLPQKSALVVVVLTLSVVGMILGVQGLWLVLAFLVVFFVLRTLMMRRLGGTTGDTAGALVEVTETGVLLAAVIT